MDDIINEEYIYRQFNVALAKAIEIP